MAYETTRAYAPRERPAALRAAAPRVRTLGARSHAGPAMLGEVDGLGKIGRKLKKVVKKVAKPVRTAIKGAALVVAPTVAAPLLIARQQAKAAAARAQEADAAAKMSAPVPMISPSASVPSGDVALLRAQQAAQQEAARRALAPSTSMPLMPEPAPFMPSATPGTFGSGAGAGASLPAGGALDFLKQPVVLLGLAGLAGVILLARK